MARMRLAVLAMVFTVGMSALAISGCTLHDPYSKTYGVETPETGVMVADAAVVRPLTLAASTVGFFGWLVTLPFTVAGGNAREVGKAWVLDPLEYTFKRPLGVMDEGAKPYYERTPVAAE